MIIVSQEREVTINYDKVILMNVENDTIVANLEQEGEIYIAKYKTRERAREVLKEITDRYESLEVAKLSTRYELTHLQDTFKYEMPLE